MLRRQHARLPALTAQVLLLWPKPADLEASHACGGSHLPRDLRRRRKGSAGSAIRSAIKLTINLSIGFKTKLSCSPSTTISIGFATGLSGSLILFILFILFIKPWTNRLPGLGLHLGSSFLNLLPLDHRSVPQIDPHVAGETVRVLVVAPLIEKRRIQAHLKHPVGIEREEAEPAVAVVGFFPLEVKEQLVYPLAGVRLADAIRHGRHLWRHVPAQHEQAVGVPADELLPKVASGVDGGLGIFRNGIRQRA